MGSAALDPLSNKAIEAALNNNWSEAVQLNNSLLELYPDDVDTLNRLARAYYESGKIARAKSTYKTVLNLDPYNPIANKNILKLADIKESTIAVDNHNGHSGVSITDLFLEEPGRTKMVALTIVKSAARLSRLRTGDQLVLKAKYNDVLVMDNSGKELGLLDPAWSKRIAEALRLGSEFEAYLASVSSTKEKPSVVFIRESVHSKGMENRSVFPIEKLDDFRPYVTEEALTLITSKGPAINSDESSPEETSSSENASLEALADKESDEMDSFDDSDA